MTRAGAVYIPISNGGRITSLNRPLLLYFPLLMHFTALIDVTIAFAGDIIPHIRVCHKEVIITRVKNTENDDVMRIIHFFMNSLLNI